MCAWILILLPARAGLAKEKTSLTVTAPQGEKPWRISLSADRLRYQPTKGKILLSGRVTISAAAPPIKLTAKQLTVLLNRQGRPLRFQARGGVTLSLGKNNGTAGRVDFHLASKRLELSDRPRLFWASLGLSLQGQRIQVDLTSGQLSVQQAKARMEQEAAKGDGQLQRTPRSKSQDKGPGHPDSKGSR